MNASLPDYAERLAALHDALADDFRRMISRLPLAGGETVVDAGCGDGFFSALLAERLPRGKVIALDASPEFLAVARRRLAGQVKAHRAEVVEGDVSRLPFDAGSVDVVWSAHSMQSYADIPHVLREFRRVLCSGGLLAILETDGAHSIMLSWPPDLELALLRAEHREIGDEDSYLGTYFPRFAQRLLMEAGFEQITRDDALINRQQPCGDSLAKYVELLLHKMLHQYGEHLGQHSLARLRDLASPHSPRFLPRQVDFNFASLQALVTARTAVTA